jgi:hypothetical protein
MTIIAILEPINDDDLSQSLVVRLSIWRDDPKTNRNHVIRDGVRGNLILARTIDLNREFGNLFTGKVGARHNYYGLELPAVMDTNIDRENWHIDVRDKVERLESALNLAIDESSWFPIREAILGALIGFDLTEPLRFAVSTNNYHLQSLPFERSAFIQNMVNQQNRPVSVVFSPTNVGRLLVWQSQVNMLVILGSQLNIEQPFNLAEISRLFGSDVSLTTLSPHSGQEISDAIQSQRWDIIICIAHSRVNTDGSDGTIDLNDRDRISIQDFTKPFRTAVDRGLKLVIMAGCSSIGLGRKLASADVKVPNVISFRQPVHHEAVRLLLTKLKFYWIDLHQSLEVAFINTTQEIRILDGKYPGSSIVPIMFSPPHDPPLIFPARSKFDTLIKLKNWLFTPQPISNYGNFLKRCIIRR